MGGMKAILVLDGMPCACAECPLCVHAKFDYYFDEHICTANGQEILDEREVHRMCPLKEMPSEKDVDYSKEFDYQDGYYAEGWNACVEYLEGDEEEE